MHDDPRLAPVDPPYAPEVQAAFDVLMRGQPPLLLFRTMAHNPRVLQRMIAGGLLDKGSISLRARELMILRTCARCGAEYEWGVHIQAFGARCGWTAEQMRSTVHGDARDACWSDEERIVLRLADELRATATVDDALWSEAAAMFGPPQLVELLALAGLYGAVSILVNALRIAHEPSAPRFPA
ncbi:MAG TPA: carboxymuconolactone decarboxylase family protein [Caldimonas sp.]|nr:carboxymuconolactone decarboxylase family protein [Caldimonas sp.]